jgi:hypothetical protein
MLKSLARADAGWASLCGFRPEVSDVAHVVLGTRDAPRSLGEVVRSGRSPAAGVRAVAIAEALGLVAIRHVLGVGALVEPR